MGFYNAERALMIGETCERTEYRLPVYPGGVLQWPRKAWADLMMFMRCLNRERQQEKLPQFVHEALSELENDDG